MKILLALIPLFASFITYSQDSVKTVEPQQPSTQNYDLLLLAVAGLVILIALYFLFRKTRRK